MLYTAVEDENVSAHITRGDAKRPLHQRQPETEHDVLEIVPEHDAKRHRDRLHCRKQRHFHQEVIHQSNDNEKGCRVDENGESGDESGYILSQKALLRLDAEVRETPRINNIVSSLIAMLQGVEVLCSLSIMYLYKDDFAMTPAVMSIVLGALRIPWTVKPLWALMSDAFPLFGYRRKSYIFIGAGMCLFSTLCMGLWGFKWFWSTTVLLLMYFVGSAICNVIGEALVVEAGRNDMSDDAAGKTVSTFFATRKLSFAAMSYLSGFLLAYMSKEYVFLIATIMPISVLVASFFMDEPKCRVLPVDIQLRRLVDVVKQPVLLHSTLFIFFMMSTPSAGSAMFYFMSNELKFNPEVMGRMALFQSIASLLGILCYMLFFVRTSIRKLLIVSTLLITPFCILPIIVVERWNLRIGIPDSWFVVSDTVLMEFIGEFQAMPILVLAARLCPPGLESTIYSFLLSSYNLGLGLGSLVSAGLTAVFGVTSTGFENLSWMILVCAMSNLLPISVVWLVPNLSVSSSHEEFGTRVSVDDVSEDLVLLKSGDSSTAPSDTEDYPSSEWSMNRSSPSTCEGKTQSLSDDIHTRPATSSITHAEPNFAADGNDIISVGEVRTQEVETTRRGNESVFVNVEEIFLTTHHARGDCGGTGEE